MDKRIFSEGENMLDKVKSTLASRKKRSLGMLAGGMVGIMGGAKLSAMALFAKGLYDLEQEWREDHPEFNGGLKERWQAAIDFYDQTHQDKVNRALHIVGIPMIFGGAMGMLAFPRYSPPWFLSQWNYGAGWALNFVGHGLFEKGAPAFADDPLAFVAGPAWDFIQLKDKVLSLLPNAPPASISAAD